MKGLTTTGQHRGVCQLKLSKRLACHLAQVAGGNVEGVPATEVAGLQNCEIMTVCCDGVNLDENGRAVEHLSPNQLERLGVSQHTLGSRKAPQNLLVAKQRQAIFLEEDQHVDFNMLNFVPRRI